jgi:outer membrane lipoprotein-sorting protein
MKRQPASFGRRRALLAGAAVGAGLACPLLARPSVAWADDVAQAGDVDQALRDIAAARASLKTLVAPFEQTRTMGLLAAEVKSKGEMTLVRPDRLRWELFPPDAITYWITPDGFAYKTANGGVNAGKSAAGKFGAVLGDLLIMLGGDLDKLKKRYRLSLVKRDDKGLTLEARPQTDEVKKHVRRLVLTAGPELWKVRQIILEEASGDQSVIRFTGNKRDVAVDPSKMKPPS